MSGLRILHVVHDHPAWTAGGTEIVARDLAREMAARPGIAARLLCAATRLHRPESAPGALETVGEDLVLMTGGYDRFTMLRRDGDGWVASFERAIRAARPDVVHLHGLDRIGAEILAVLRRVAPRRRIVLTLHDYQLICPNDGLLVRTHDGSLCRGFEPDGCRRCFPDQSMARHVLRRANLLALLDGVSVFVAPSAFVRDRFVAWGLPAARIVVLSNPAPEAPPEPTVGAAVGRPRARFAYFGSIAPHKGVLTLLDAAARLKARGRDATLTLHGGFGHADEAFRAAVAAALASAAPLAVHVGPYDRADVVARMRCVDWIVAPSLWWEGAPLTVLEAQAAGRPVICSGVGGLAELVRDGVDGLHAPPGDPVALADVMEAAAGDVALWDRLRRAAPRRPCVAECVDQHLQLYEALFARRPA